MLKEIETLTKNTTISKITRKNILKKLNISDFSTIHSNFSKIWNLIKIFDFLNQEDYIFNIANSNKNYMYKKDFILINSFFEQNKHINKKEYFPDSIKIEYIDDLDESTKDRFI